MTLHFDNTAGDQLPLMTLDAHPMDRHYETMYEVHDPALKLMARQLFGEGASCTNAFRALCLPLVAPTLAWHARDTDIGTKPSLPTLWTSLIVLTPTPWIDTC